MLDSDGRRRRFKLDILNLYETGLTKVGQWNPDDGFDDLRLMNELKIKHFNILITMVIDDGKFEITRGFFECLPKLFHCYRVHLTPRE